jgi:hypothetical protein
LSELFSLGHSQQEVLVALGEELVGVAALPLVLLPGLLLLLLLLLKIQAVLLRYFVVVVVVVVDAFVAVASVVAATFVVASNVVVKVVAIVAGVAANPDPDAATLPPAHPSCHLPNLLALVAAPPSFSPPRVAAPLPLRHPKSGDTCFNFFRS